MSILSRFLDAVIQIWIVKVLVQVAVVIGSVWLMLQIPGPIIAIIPGIGLIAIAYAHWR
jgi:hypothetical protein